MSGLAARIGSNCLKIRKFVFINGLVPSVKTVTNNLSKIVPTSVGIGIAVTPLFATSMFVHGKENEESGKKIYRLDEIVKTSAINAFKQHTCTHPNCSRIIEDYDCRLDWSGVKFTPGEPEFIASSNEGKKVDAKYVVFKTVYKNNSMADQQHTLKTIVETSSTCESSLTNGFTKGFDAKLSLTAPFKIANAAVGFSKGFPVTSNKNVEESSRSWSVEDCIKVPRNSHMNASIEIKETQHAFTFHSWVAVQGHAKVIFTKGEIRHQVAVPMAAIINEEFPEDMVKHENGIDCIKIEGNCKFKYAVELEIIIN